MVERNDCGDVVFNTTPSMTESSFQWMSMTTLNAESRIYFIILNHQSINQKCISPDRLHCNSLQQYRAVYGKSLLVPVTVQHWLLIIFYLFHPFCSIARNMKNHLPLLISTFSAIGSTCAFVPAQTPSIGTTASKRSNNRRESSSSILHREINNDCLSSPTRTALFSDQKKKGGIDETMRNKLVTESIAPWRTLRLFLYGSFGTGAFIGGLVNGSGAIAASNSPEFNLQTEVRHIWITVFIIFCCEWIIVRPNVFEKICSH